MWRFSSEVDTSWGTYLNQKWDGGKKKVPNPDGASALRYPEVAMSTLMQKDPVFAEKIRADYKKWIAEQRGESAPSSSDGEDPDGEDPDGEDPDGEDPDGEDPDGEDPDGEDPDGEDPDYPLGDDSADIHFWEDPDGEDPDGEDPEGEDPDGEDPDGEDPDGESEFGDDPEFVDGEEDFSEEEDEEEEDAPAGQVGADGLAEATHQSLEKDKQHKQRMRDLEDLAKTFMGDSVDKAEDDDDKGDYTPLDYEKLDRAHPTIRKFMGKYDMDDDHLHAIVSAYNAEVEDYTKKKKQYDEWASYKTQYKALLEYDALEMEHKEALQDHKDLMLHYQDEMSVYKSAQKMYEKQMQVFGDQALIYKQETDMYAKGLLTDPPRKPEPPVAPVKPKKPPTPVAPIKPTVPPKPKGQEPKEKPELNTKEMYRKIIQDSPDAFKEAVRAGKVTEKEIESFLEGMGKTGSRMLRLAYVKPELQLHLLGCIQRR